MNLLVRGMHGMGDCIHQRAVLRLLLEKYDQIWLESSWVSIYHDLPRVHVVHKGTSLRTQTKNAQREASRFQSTPPGLRSIQVGYPPAAVRAHGSPLAAMCAQCGVDVRRADFRLPVPQEWGRRADDLIRGWRSSRPILIFRPLMERTEWTGCRNRNADYDAYRDLLASIRNDFFVVSVGDFVTNVEWIVGHPVAADVELHKGELDFEIMAALFERAALVFASPGFAIVLAQAVGTPSVCVYGGYEAGSFGLGKSPHLAIEPITPCRCYSHTHACRKQIDMPAAIERLMRFANVAAADTAELAGGSTNSMERQSAILEPG